jgi:preflagellin peptidase FlaK
MISIPLISTSIPLICTFIAILACIYASYTDLKRGIIANKLTFPLIGLGIALNGINAFFTGNLMILVYTLLFTGTIFVLGYIFWKLGAWAGGDVKMFTALAALLPLQPVLISYTILGYSLPVMAKYPFPFTVIINSILAILPFLLIFVFYIVYTEKRELLGELSAPLKDYQKNFLLALVVTSAITTALYITQIFALQVIILILILTYILTMVISKIPNRIKAVVVSILTVYAIFQNPKVALVGILVIFISITIIEILKKLLTSVNRKALQDDYTVVDLKEGMIMAYGLYEKDEKVYFDSEGMVSKFKKASKTGELSLITAPKGKMLLGTLAAGLTEKDIELLKGLVNENKIKDSIRVKRGVPFAPSILIGLLISLFIGDLAYIFFKLVEILV